MTKGIDISIAADTKSAMAAIQRGVLEPLEDVSEELEKLGDDSKDAGRDLERSMRDAQRRTNDAADKIADLRNELNRAGRAARDTGDDAKAGMDRIKAGAQEVQQEIGQNLGEAVSSLRGDLSDLGQVGQDTLGGLAATLAGTGPAGIIGAAALAAGAVGLGLVTQSFADIEEAKKRVAENGSEWAQGIIDGSRDVESALGKLAIRQGALTGDYDEVKKWSDAWGVDMMTAAGALGGIPDDIAAVQAALDAQADALDRASEANRGNQDAWSQALSTWATGGKQLGEAQGKVDELTGALQRQSDITALTQQGYREAINAASELGVEVDALGNQLLTFPDGKQLVITANTGEATANLDKFGEDADGVIESISGKEAIARVKGDTTAADRDFESVERRTFRDKTVGVRTGPMDDATVRGYTPSTIWIPTKLKRPDNLADLP